MKQYLYAILEKAAKPQDKKYTTEDLRAHANSYGWPQEIVNSMSIDYTGTVKFSNPKYKKAAMDLDYGTQDVPLSPAIRTFLLGVM
jgi:hypothetical protein